MRFGYDFAYLLWCVLRGGLCSFRVGCTCWLFALFIDCEGLL